jgi:ribosomal protein L11 methylase PrmA
LAGLLGLSGVLAARSWLAEYANLANSNHEAPPRVGLNAPYIKTADKIADKMVELGLVWAGDMVYDLGCGDGRLVITAAEQHGCRGIGFDIEPLRITEADENARQHNVDQLVTFQQQDVFTVDLVEADVVLMYLLPWMLRDLVPQFDQCRPGTRLVSHDFTIEGVEVDHSEEVWLADGDRHLVHVYITPLKKIPPRPRKRQF